MCGCGGRHCHRINQHNVNMTIKMIAIIKIKITSVINGTRASIGEHTEKIKINSAKMWKTIVKIHKLKIPTNISLGFGNTIISKSSNPTKIFIKLICVNISEYKILNPLTIVFTNPLILFLLLKFDSSLRG